ncbi:hypothetical protein D9M68_648100 [compost metagenome]
MQPRADDRDLDLAVALRRLAHRHVLFVQVEQAEEVDEIALDEAQAAQVGEFVIGKAQLAQVRDLGTNLIDIRRQVDAGVAALEAIFDLRLRKLVQDHLHHRELVQVGVEQRLDDHG